MVVISAIGVHSSSHPWHGRALPSKVWHGKDRGMFTILLKTSSFLQPISPLVQVFVLTTLQQLEPQDGEVGVVVLCHTRELAYQVGRCTKND